MVLFKLKGRATKQDLSRGLTNVRESACPCLSVGLVSDRIRQLALLYHLTLQARKEWAENSKFSKRPEKMTAKKLMQRAASAPSLRFPVYV